MTCTSCHCGGYKYKSSKKISQKGKGKGKTGGKKRGKNNKTKKTKRNLKKTKKYLKKGGTTSYTINGSITPSNLALANPVPITKYSKCP